MSEENNTEQNPPDETTPEDTKKAKKKRNPGEAFETKLAVGRNTLKLSADDPGLKAYAASVGYDAAAIAQG
ncbi:MAG: hypothetical protein NT166_28355 [Candidatus Aminicenantes bacterium]|nr:hypothetical protein [Candidatus Aminicenantes bacterium]